jgi:hypothetical protein
LPSFEQAKIEYNSIREEMLELIEETEEMAD